MIIHPLALSLSLRDDTIWENGCYTNRLEYLSYDVEGNIFGTHATY